MSKKLIRAFHIFRQDGLQTLIKKGLEFLRIIAKDTVRAIVYTIVLTIPAKIIETEQDLYLFSARNGEYEGNSRYLFEWILENRPALNPVFVTAHKNTYHKLRKKNLPCAYTYSIKGIHLLLKGSILFFTNGVKDIGFNGSGKYLGQSTTLVDLRHGRPVKFGPNYFKSDDASYHNFFDKRSSIDYTITTSNYMADLDCQLFRDQDKEQFRDQYLITGYPRNDVLFDSDANKFEYITEQLANVPDFDAIVLYAPTRRRPENGHNTDIFPFTDFSKDYFVDFIESNKILLLIKLHPSDTDRLNSTNVHFETVHDHPTLSEFLDELTESTDNIKLMTRNQIDDINNLLPHTDILITDYSSIYHDYLLLDRPIFFIPYDFEDFNDHYGFIYDYYENMPGPDIDSTEKFYNIITNVLSGNDIYKKERRSLRDKIHEYLDDNASERVIRKLMS